MTCLKPSWAKQRRNFSAVSAEKFRNSRLMHITFLTLLVTLLKLPHQAARPDFSCLQENYLYGVLAVVRVIVLNLHKLAGLSLKELQVQC